MNVFLISSNVLFTETLINTVLKAVAAQVIPLKPDAAPAALMNSQPEVILVDESGTSLKELNEILETIRYLPNSRTILLSLQNNDVVILNAHRATIRKAEDLLNTIQNKEEMQTTDLIAEIRTRASIYGFLASLCNQRPDLYLVRRLRTLGIQSFLDFVDQGEAFEDIRNGLRQISQFIAGMPEQSDEQIEQALAVDWTRLFRGLRPGYGPPPPYEGVYLGVNDIQALQEVVRFYREHGVEPSEDAGNRPDYIGLELDFLRYLCEQQVQSLEKGHSEEAEHWQRTEHDFLENHFDKWVPGYCERAIEEAQTDFYRGCVTLIKAAIKATVRSDALKGGAHG